MLRLGTVRWRQGGDVYSAAYSPDGSRLVTGGGDGTIRVWDAATGKELRRITGHANIVFAVYLVYVVRVLEIRPGVIGLVFAISSIAHASPRVHVLNGE